jgi:hypothetical protein
LGIQEREKEKLETTVYNITSQKTA